MEEMQNFSLGTRDWKVSLLPKDQDGEAGSGGGRAGLLEIVWG